jgi:hypothetical protein
MGVGYIDSDRQGREFVCWTKVEVCVFYVGAFLWAYEVLGLRWLGPCMLGLGMSFWTIRSVLWYVKRR